MPAAKDEPVYWLGQIEWFLTRADAALGSKGTLAGVIAVLERGGPGPSGTLVDPYGPGVIGESARFRNDGAVARYRQIWPRWRWLSAEHQGTLVAHYTTSRLPAGVDAAFRIAKRNAGDHSVSFGAVALLLAKSGAEVARVLKACEELDKQPQESRHGWMQTTAGRERLACLRGPMARAQTAVAAAHAAYLATANSEAILWAM